MASINIVKHSLTHRRRLMLKVMRILFYSIGGVFISKEISNSLKILWFCISLVCTVINISGTIAYFLTTNNNDLFSSVTALWITFYTFYFLIILPIATFIYHSDLQKVLNYIRNHRPNCQYQVPKRDSLSEVILWSFIVYSFISFTELIDPIDVLFICKNNNSFHDVNHHTVIFPYFNRIPPSINMILLMYGFELTIAAVGISLIIFLESFFILITREFKNISTDYNWKVKHLLKTTRADDHWYEWSEMKLISFRRNFISIVKQHQTFVK